MNHGSYEHRVTCNLHTEEFQMIARQAASLSMKMGPFIRQSAIAICKKQRVVDPTTRDLLDRLCAQIRRIASDLTTIASHTNIVQSITFQEQFYTSMLMLHFDQTMQRLVGAQPQIGSRTSLPRHHNFLKPQASA